jgi:hypothetical protein
MDELANELVKLARGGECEGTICARTAEAAARLGPSRGDLGWESVGDGRARLSS